MAQKILSFNMVFPVPQVSSLFHLAQKHLFRGAFIEHITLQHYAQLAESHPNYADILFDEHFVKRHVVVLLQAADQQGVELTPDQVLLAWKRQFALTPSKLQEACCQTMKVPVTTFVRQLNEALK